MWKYGEAMPDPGMIENFERRLGITLPASYKSTILDNEGAVCSGVTLSIFNPQTQETEMVSLGALIPFTSLGDEYSTMDSLHFGGGDVVPNGIIAFASEGGGYKWGFDYRGNRAHADPPIVLLHRDNLEKHYVVPAAANFQDLLRKLAAEDSPTNPEP